MIKKVCSFCGTKESKDNKVIAGNGAYICSNCVKGAFNMINGKSEEPTKNSAIDKTELLNSLGEPMIPKDLHAKLNEYVIGQERAKKLISVAVYNHYKRVHNALEDSDDDGIEIEKSNVLLIGPSGSGKTLIAQTIAKSLELPIAITDATSLTEAGYVGEDVENILTKLYLSANEDIAKTERGIIFIDEIDKIARMSENRSITRDVSGEGVQQALLKIIEGAEVNISPKGGRKHPNQDFITINTKHILFICGGAFDGLGEILKQRSGQNILGFGHDKKSTDDTKPSFDSVEPDDLVKYGIVPELIGRLPIIASLNEITEEDMIRILKEPKNSIIKQYQKLFSMDDATLVFNQDALEAIAQKAIDRKTGARGLRAIIEEKILDIMYDLPEYRGFEAVVTKEVINDGAEPIYTKHSEK